MKNEYFLAITNKTWPQLSRNKDNISVFFSFFWTSKNDQMKLIFFESPCVCSPQANIFLHFKNLLLRISLQFSIDLNRFLQLDCKKILTLTKVFWNSPESEWQKITLDNMVIFFSQFLNFQYFENEISFFFSRNIFFIDELRKQLGSSYLSRIWSGIDFSPHWSDLTISAVSTKQKSGKWTFFR